MCPTQSTPPRAQIPAAHPPPPPPRLRAHPAHPTGPPSPGLASQFSSSRGPPLLLGRGTPTTCSDRGAGSGRGGTGLATSCPRRGPLGAGAAGQWLVQVTTRAESGCWRQPAPRRPTGGSHLAAVTLRLVGLGRPHRSGRKVARALGTAHGLGRPRADGAMRGLSRSGDPEATGPPVSTSRALGPGWAWGASLSSSCP